MNTDETPMVEMTPDGEIKCAKGLDSSECGYKPGAKVCGKCGAMAVMEKSAKSNFETGWVDSGEKAGMYGSAPAPMRPRPAAPMMAEEEEEDEEEMTPPARPMTGMGGGAPAPAAPMAAPAPARQMTPAPAPAMNPEDQEPVVEPEDDMTEDDEEKMWGQLENMLKRRKKARAKRMKTMGIKSASLISDENSFVCAIERKMLPGGSNICANCPGGCEPHGDMPTLLEIEGIAEDMFGGKILDSGYADQTDIFVVDVQRKDGRPIEAYFDGSSGECMGWHLLNENLVGEVTAVKAQKIISFDEAADIATKSIEGDVVAVDADLFEGYDAYAVEIEGIDGKSYDVFVGIDGEVLGYDEYEPDEAAEIDAEVADLALKRMYGSERRTELAKGGMALPDGSYPIVDESDLKNAIQAYGRAKDKEAAKRHIMKRARALGKEGMIPDEWKSTGKSLSDDETKELLGSLIEFEMLAIEHGDDGGKK